jgi:hypothetical protein
MIPLLLTLTGSVDMVAGACDNVVGLKNWFGSVIHSFSCELNGTTIVQQTPFSGMWNCFKLMSSLSMDDVRTQGPTIGFFPDNALSVGNQTAIASTGKGVFNNVVNCTFPSVVGRAVGDQGNTGLLRRMQSWNFDPDASSAVVGTAYSGMITAQTCSNLWKSYISYQPANSAGTRCYQVSILAQVMLKHLHEFFERIPLIKGVFFKMIFNLNQTAVKFTTVATGPNAQTISCTGVNSPLGGVSPIMITAGNATAAATTPLSGLLAGNYIASLSVGATCNNSDQIAQFGGALPTGQVGGGSIQLIVPSYTFNPVFESSYLASPIKKIIYEDIYQYTVAGVAPQSPFTYLISNGIAGVKKVLVLPYYTASSNSVGIVNCAPFQSPFDPAGCGPTSPFCLFSNFNVQISGQNAIYNIERYSFEQFSNQLYGQLAVNGGLTDGLTSGLVDKQAFETEYCYYLVNVERCLPMEVAVPKAINLIGQNNSVSTLDLYVFISYSVEISLDLLSGSRV